jgi:ABC-2 family transporter protein
MTRSALLSAPLKKELRALTAPWLGCLAVMATCALQGGWSWLVTPTYVLAAAALGALSMGHEYSNRTMALFLSQPARRSRLFVLKFGVLAAVLLSLCVVAGLFVVYTSGAHIVSADPSRWAAVLILPALCGLFLAPCLTMLCRSAIAGAVFSLAIPGLLFTIAQVIASTNYGSHSQAERFSMSALWGGTLGLCAVGGVLGWRTFMRLEVTEGPGSEMRLPPLLRLSRTLPASRGLIRHRPVWLLVKKELRLQQMALAISGLYVAGWAGVVAMQYLAPDLELDFFNVLTVFYSGLIALLIGSLACAEERQMGTLESQVLLPMATWKQWNVKVAVVLGLSMILALGLPALLTGRLPVPPAGMLHGPWFVAAPIVVLTIGGLYVSSLCSSGLWALLMALPAMLGTVAFVEVIAGPLERWIYPAWPRRLVGVRHAPIEPSTIVEHVLLQPPAILVLGLLLMVGLLALLLRFGLANYRSADRGRNRVARQAAYIAVCLAIGQSILTGAVAMHWTLILRGMR